MQIPDGIYTATAQVVPGWEISKTSEALPEPVDDGHGGQYTDATPPSPGRADRWPTTSSRSSASP